MKGATSLIPSYHVGWNLNWHQLTLAPNQLLYLLRASYNTLHQWQLKKIKLDLLQKYSYKLSLFFKLHLCQGRKNWDRLLLFGKAQMSWEHCLLFVPAELWQTSMRHKNLCSYNGFLPIPSNLSHGKMQFTCGLPKEPSAFLPTRIPVKSLCSCNL